MCRLFSRRINMNIFKKQKDYLKWLFRKPSINFDRKLKAKDVVELFKTGNLYELRNLLPKQKGLSRKETLITLGIAGFIGVVSSFVLGNPIPFFMVLAITYGSEYAFNSATTAGTSVAVLDSTHFVVAYTDTGNSSYGTAIIGVISGTTIAYGSEYPFNEASTSNSSVSALDATHFVVSYTDAGNSSYGTSIFGTVANGDEISYGAESNFNEASTAHISSVKISSTTFVVSCRDTGAGGDGTSLIGTVSGTTISFGSEYTFTTSALYTSTILLDSTHFIVSYRDGAVTNYGTSNIGTITGTAIAFGSKYVFNSARSDYVYSTLLDSTHFVVSYQDVDNSGYGTSVVGVISGATITFGSEYPFIEGYVYNPTTLKVDSTHFIISCRDYSGTQGGAGTSLVGTVANGDELSYGDSVVFNAGDNTFISSAMIDSTDFVVSYIDTVNSSYGTAIIGEYTAPVTANTGAFFQLF